MDPARIPRLALRTSLLLAAAALLVVGFTLARGPANASSCGPIHAAEPQGEDWVGPIGCEQADASEAAACQRASQEERRMYGCQRDA